jgi:sugar transferase (PEP-CTERM/EpsH1 system associated)
MKVLFLSQIVPYPPHGGVLQRGYHLLRELSRFARVHLLAFVHPDELPSDQAVEESRCALSAFCESVEYFPLWGKTSAAHHVAALATTAMSHEPFSFVAYRSSAFRRRVADKLAGDHFDLVHGDTIGLTQFVAPEERPCVLTHHNVESILMRRRADVERRPLARRFLQRETHKLARYEAVTSPRYDVNIMVSHHDARTLSEMVPGVRTAIVPNGVDIEYFKPACVDEGAALIYAGGMNMFANRDAVTHFLDEIWPRVTAAEPLVRFFAVGQDPPKTLLAAAARDPRIIVTGKVDDIRPYVCEASVYVVPLRVGGGTRLKVLDAMAMAKALVSTSVGCEGIEANPGEHLVTADTPETFADATVALIRDRNRRRALGSAARALVERRYAWSVVGEQLMEAYGAAMAAKACVR